MNIHIFFETLAELYAAQHAAKVASIKITEKEPPRAS